MHQIKPEILENLVETLNLMGGEADVLKCFKIGKYDAISSDDSKFLNILESLNINYLTPTALIVYLFKKKKVTKCKALSSLERLKVFVSPEEFYLALNEIEG